MQTSTALRLGDVAASSSRSCALAIGNDSPRAWAPKVNASLTGRAYRLAPAGIVDEHRFLLVRRCLDDPSILAYFLVWAPPQTPLPLMVQAIGARWHIEEDLETCKDLGLGHYEGRRYLGWYRHITLVQLASAFLLSITIEHHRSVAASPIEACEHTPLIPLTCSEARHLLAHLFFPASCSPTLLMQWSLFRRGHQYWAGYYHRRRRQKAP